MTGPTRRRAALGGPPHRYTLFAVVGLSILMISIDQTIVATALVAIQQDLDAEFAWASWIITVYSLGLLVTMPVAGSIADQFGRKRIFLAAIVLFGCATVLCAISQNIQMLIVSRALQAIGAGAFVPCATGIVAEHFGENRDRAIGLFTSIFPVGAIMGPVLGGLIVSYADWRYIFIVNVPVSALLVLMVMLVVPDSAAARTEFPDVLGSFFLAGSLLLAMLGLSLTGAADRAILKSTLCGTVAVILGGIFLLRISRVANPIIPMSLLRGRGLLLMNVLNLAIGAAAFGLGTLAPLYAELRFGLSPLDAGSLLAIRALGMISLAGLAAWTLRRTGYRAPMMAGLILTAGGLVMTSLAPRAGLSAHGWLGVALGITGVGMGLALPAANNASLQLARTQVSAVVGIRGMFRQGGGMISVSLASILMTHSAAPSATLAAIYLGFGLALALMSLLVIRVPDHHGGW